MYTISKEIEFDAGHRVPLHESKCRNPHGHRYKVQAIIEGELITEGPEAGMVKDFSNIKALLVKHVEEKYDHGFIAYEDDKVMIECFAGALLENWKIIWVPFYPTAECLAKAIYDDMKPELPNLVTIVIWETPTSIATYTDYEEAADTFLEDMSGRE